MLAILWHCAVSRFESFFFHLPAGGTRAVSCELVISSCTAQMMMCCPVIINRYIVLHGILLPYCDPTIGSHLIVLNPGPAVTRYVCVCVCVCVWEREREKMRVKIGSSWDKDEVLIYKHKTHRRFSSNRLNAHFLYSITIYMLHYNPPHVLSSTLLIFRRTNCIITASGIITQTAVQYAGWEWTAVRSQPAYCMAIYREWRYQRL